MKRMFLGLFAVLLAVATVFATEQPRSAKDPVLHWFTPDGTYIGEEDFSVMFDLCPYTVRECALGYTDTDIQNGKVVPAGTLEETVFYPN